MQENAQLELQRLQLIGVLTNAADSLRTAAGMAEGFAATLQHTTLTPQNANTMNPLSMFQSFAQMFGGGANGALANGSGVPVATSVPVQQQASPASGGSSKELAAEGGEEKKKRKRGSNDPAATKAEKKKKEKDPNAPKKPASAYILFQNDVRDEFRKQHPNEPYGTILNKISEAWAALGEDQKKVYNDMVHQKKVVYDAQKEQYDAKRTAGTVEEAVTSPEDVVPETPSGGHSEAEQSEASSDEEEVSKPVAKKSKANAKAAPATPLSTSSANKQQATPLTKEKEKEKEKAEKKKKDKRKKADN